MPKLPLNKFAYILFLGVLALPLVQYHVSAFGYIGIGGLFVNDSLGMASNLYIFAKGDDLNYLGILGVLLLYYPSHYIGNIFNFVLNIGLLLLSANFFLKTLAHLRVVISPVKSTTLFLFVVFNFYLLLVLFYPNKEIPLIALTNAFFYYAIVKRNPALTLGSIFFSFLIRDGHGIILASTYLVIFFSKTIVHKSPIRMLFVIYCVFSIVSIKFVASLDLFGEYNYILNRNVYLVEDVDSALSNSILNSLPSYISFPIKIFNHFAGSVLRPQFFDLNDRLYLHGIGLWQNGLAIFLGIIAGFRVLLKPSKYDPKVILLIFSLFLALLIVSVGSYTQARYLMPYIFWLAFFPIFFFRINSLFIFALGLILSSILLSFAGYGSQIPLGIDVSPFSYF